MENINLHEEHHRDYERKLIEKDVFPSPCINMITSRFYSLLKFLPLIILSGCSKSPESPGAPTGASEAALLTRAKLHILYTFNNTPAAAREDIYVSLDHEPKDGITMYNSLDDIDKYYHVTILDKSSTQAIVLSTANDEKGYWFWGPYSKDEWQLIDGNWKWVGLSEIDELTTVGAELLDSQ